MLIRRPRRTCAKILCYALPAVGASVAGCHGEEPKPRAPGPIPVQMVKVTPEKVVDEDDYLASLTSRHSVTLYAQVSGVILSLGARPGETVKAGAMLVQIDPAQQASTLRSLQAAVATKEASLAYAVFNDESSRGLAAAGVLSGLDYEQRRSQRVSAKADVRTAQAQRDAQSDLLRYYRINAPTDGVVGDIPVKLGDYVTPQTRLTTVDQDKLIEAYVYLPVERIADLKPDTRLSLVTEDGKVLCDEKPSFVSPEVSVDTQSVLVKAVCPNTGSLRASRVMTARVVWATFDSLTVPTSATTRNTAQYFVYVAREETSGDGGTAGLVAHQVPVDLGAIQKNSFIVKKGLAPGDLLITSSIQKLRDGAPVTRLPDAPPPAASAAPSPHASTD